MRGPELVIPQHTILKSYVGVVALFRSQHSEVETGDILDQLASQTG